MGGGERYVKLKGNTLKYRTEPAGLESEAPLTLSTAGLEERGVGKRNCGGR